MKGDNFSKSLADILEKAAKSSRQEIGGGAREGSVPLVTTVSAALPPAPSALPLPMDSGALAASVAASRGRAGARTPLPELPQGFSPLRRSEKASIEPHAEVKAAPSPVEQIAEPAPAPPTVIEAPAHRVDEAPDVILDGVPADTAAATASGSVPDQAPDLVLLEAPVPPSKTPRLAWALGAMSLLICAGWLFWSLPARLSVASAPTAPARVTPKPSPAVSVAPATAPQPQVAVAVPPVVPPVELSWITERTEREGANSAMALAASSAGRVHFSPVEADGWAAGLAGLRRGPGATVVRYDVLQAAQRAPASFNIPALEIVAPVGIDPVMFVVRNDSPLRFVHQIATKTIDVGPAAGSRALTAGGVYTALFGTTLPAWRVGRLNEQAALMRLIDDSSLDVVAMVGPTGLAALSSLPPDKAANLRMLSLDSKNLASQRATRAYLPVAVGAALPAPLGTQAAPTLGVMSFVVTARADPANAVLHDEGMTALAEFLCAGQGVQGTPAPTRWRGVQPQLQVDAGWPYSAAARKAFAVCGAVPSSAGPQAATAQKSS